ncbi:MAG: hypothetical protein ACREDF_07650 [Thermoplasmata archaeon]
MRDLVVLVVLLAPIALASNGNVTVEGPRLTAGDYWAYRTNTSLESGLFLEGRVTLTVMDRAPTLVEGTLYDAYEMSVSGAGTAAGMVEDEMGSTTASGSWVLTGREVVDVGGLTVLSRVFDLEANGTLHTAPFPLSFALRAQNTTAYRIQGDAWRFPLQVGHSSIVPSQMNFSEDFGLFLGLPTTPIHSAGLVWWNVTHTLQAPTGLQTPTGQFEAYPIRESYPDGTYTLFFYAPAAGNHARTETHNETSEVSRSELVAYRYQALEPARFLGLTLGDWVIAAVSVGVVAAGLLWWRRRKRKAVRLETTSPPPAS